MEKTENPPPYTGPGLQGASSSQPPNMYYPQQQPQTTVIVGPTPMFGGTPGVGAVIMGPQYGPATQHAHCPHCRADILTSVKAETSMRTHLYALMCCALLLWPCVFVPYCMDTCKNKNHYCPNCGSYLGTHIG